MKSIINKYLIDVNIKNALDVATGTGNQLKLISECLQPKANLFGIDNSDKGFEKAKELFSNQDKLQLIQADVTNMPFVDNYFDLISISNSLHHLEQKNEALSEIYRVLQPGGILIISEMHQDNSTETQKMHTELHHWWAEIDTIAGTFHDKTWTRQCLKESINSLEFKEIFFEDYSDISPDPFEPKLIKQLSEICEQYPNKIKHHKLYFKLKNEGLFLKDKLQQVGFHPAEQLIIIATKPQRTTDPIKQRTNKIYLPK